MRWSLFRSARATLSAGATIVPSAAARDALMRLIVSR